MSKEKVVDEPIEEVAEVDETGEVEVKKSNKRKKCPVCKGNGVIGDATKEDPKRCEKCNGTGNE